MHFIERIKNLVSINGTVLDLSCIYVIEHPTATLSNINIPPNNSLEGTVNVISKIYFEPMLENRMFLDPKTCYDLSLYKINKYPTQGDLDFFVENVFKICKEYQNYELLVEWWKDYRSHL